MKFWDSKYRLFGVINLIDLVVILAIIAGGYAVYRVLRPAGGGGKAAAGTPATFDIVCPTTHYLTQDQIKIGDAIYKNTGQQIGSVTAVRFVPSMGEAWDPGTHKVVQYNSTFAQDVIISVKTKGTSTSTGFAVGSILLHSYAPMPVMTSTFDCETSFMTNLKIGQ